MKFLHIADTHLCSVQYGDIRRGRDFLKALLACVDIAVAEGITNILHGGDLLDARDLNSIVGDQLEELDRYLVEHGVTMWVVAGNHDWCEPSWIIQVEKRRAHWAPHTVGGLRSLDHRFETLGGVTVYGLPSMGVEELKSMLAIAPQADILVWHGPVREYAGFPSEAYISGDELPLDKYRAILLGDLHVHDYRMLGNCLVGYPGSTELTNRGHDFEKFATVIEILPGQPITHRPVKIPTRKVLGWKIMNEADMEKAILDLENLRGTPLLLFVNYQSTLKDVPARLARCFNAEDVIFRPESHTVPPPPVLKLLAAANPGIEDSSVTDGAAAVLTPDDIPPMPDLDVGALASGMFAYDPALASLAGRLAVPGEDAAILVGAYIDKELASEAQ